MTTKRIITLMMVAILLYTLHITHYTSNAYAASKGNPPVAHWRFDEGGGSTAQESVAAGFSLRTVLRSLKAATTAVSDWLCPSAYAADKGAVPVAQPFGCYSSHGWSSARKGASQIWRTICDFFVAPVYAADKGNPPVAHWRFDEGGGPTAYDDSTNNNDGTLQPGLLSDNLYELRMNPGEGFFRDFAQDFPYKDLFNRSNLAQLDQGGLGKATRFLISLTQAKLKLAKFWRDVRSNSQHNDIICNLIKSIRGDGKSWPLFSSREISKWKRDKDNLTLLIGCHRRYPQGCSRNQTNLQQASKVRNLLMKSLRAQAAQSGAFAGVLKANFGLPVQLLLRKDSSYFTPIVKFTTVCRRSQTLFFEQGHDAHVIASLPQALLLRGSLEEATEAISDFLCPSAYAADKGAAPVAHHHKVAAGFSLRNAIDAGVRNLKVATTAVSAWLCPSAYAADKGNPPVAHWRFDEGGGPTAYDDVGDNDGTLVGDTKFVTGKIGKGLQLDGTGDYVTMNGLSGELSTGDPFTVTCWFKTSATPSTMYGHVLFTAHNSDGNTNIFRVGTGVNGGIFLSHNTDTENGSGYNDNNWHFLSVTVTGAGAPSVKVDNVAVSGFPTAQIAWSNAAQFSIGQDWDGATATDFWNGYIDDVRVYNYIRSASQLLVDYNAGAAAHLGAGVDPYEGNPPVAYYTMDHISGTTLYDTSGNNNNGTITGATSSQGKHGTALSFDGNDYVQVADSTTLSLTNGTVTAWVYLNDYSASYQYIASKYSPNGWYIAVDSSNKLRTARYDSSLNYLITTTDFPIQQWVHVALVFKDSDGKAKIYINGVESISEDAGDLVSSTSYMRIGRYGSDYWNGLIDEFKIYNYARTPAQIAYDYNKGKPVAHYKFDEGGGAIAHNEYSTADTGSSPVGWWRMDAASSGSANGATISDESGNGNNGTASYGGNLTGMTWTTGKIGLGALSFDGTDDYISVTSSTSINSTTTAITISLWVNLSAAPTTAYMSMVRKQGQFALDFPQSNAIRFLGSNFWTGANDAPFTPTLGQWYNIAATWSTSDNTGRIYVDGVLIKSFSTSGNMGSNGNALGIGANGTGSYTINGKIDGVRIYNYARTAEQVYNDYKTTHGTLVGDTKFVDGKIGKAVQFDGDGDRVIAPGPTWTPTEFTVEWWHNPASVVSFNHCLGAANAWGAFWFHTTNSGSAYVGTDVNTRFTPSDIPNNTLTLDTWQHLAFTFDNGAAKFYKNGVVVASKTGMTLPIAWTGFSVGSTDTTTINGKIDDVRIYNYARTTAEVMQDYNAGAAAYFGGGTNAYYDPWGGAAPVAHWSMDENTGVLAYDVSGNGNNGTLTNGPTWAQGKNGPGLKWDDVNRYVALNSTIGIGNSNFTICAWVNIPSNASGRVGNLIGNYPDTPNSNFEVHSVGQMRIWWNNGEIDQYGTRNLRDDAWHYLSYVRDKTAGKFYMYIDGILEKRITGAGTDVTFSTPFWIGSDKRSGGLPWEGSIDDVRIYNYARTQAQIAWDYNRGKPVAHWRMDEATSGSAHNQTIYDDSVHDNDGTANYGANATGMTWTSGKFGGALSFDGVDDYVNCGQVLNTDKTLPFTMSAWVNATSTSSWRTIIGTNTSYAQIAINSGNTIFGQNGGGGWWQTGNAISTGEWHHIVGVYDGANASLYVDGVLRSGPTARTFTNNHGVSLFGRYSVAGGEYFSGKIDDARIYNYARTAEQVMQDYNQGLSAKMGD